jgi:hypothetical protein
LAEVMESGAPLHRKREHLRQTLGDIGYADMNV